MATKAFRAGADNMKEKLEDKEEAMDELDDKTILEEYKVWKKNTPFLYDMVMTTTLDWPTLSVNWMKHKSTNPNCSWSAYRLVLGTHTSEQEQNYCKVAEVRLPDEARTEADVRKYETSGDFGGFGFGAVEAPRFDVKCKMSHDGEINRAVACPNPKLGQEYDNLIATKGLNGEVNIFDFTKHSMLTKDKTMKPQLKLTGLETEGWGLDWSPSKPGYIVSGGEDRHVAVWDIEGKTKWVKGAETAPTVECLQKWRDHKLPVEDVQFHRFDHNLIGSVGDDGFLVIRDMRASDTSKPHLSVLAHELGCNTLSFSPFNEHLIATGGADKCVRLWDTRKIQYTLHSVEAHKGEVTRVHWSPFGECYLASGSANDRRVVIYDLSRIGCEQSDADAADGPPEIMFIHGGHTGRLTDFAWNPNEGAEWVIASADENNNLQIWMPAESVLVDGTSDEQRAWMADQRRRTQARRAWMTKHKIDKGDEERYVDLDFRIASNFALSREEAEAKIAQRKREGQEDGDDDMCE
eukprot:GDKI01036072.1.p1 GENE.GDKI01036072.1~~GDKI01036072.1.p1  ORF type:complete len:521 (-),score=180.01 GDKI01036072.1:159-1721(-)